MSGITSRPLIPDVDTPKRPQAEVASELDTLLQSPLLANCRQALDVRPKSGRLK